MEYNSFEGGSTPLSSKIERRKRELGINSLSSTIQKRKKELGIGNEDLHSKIEKRRQELFNPVKEEQPQRQEIAQPKADDAKQDKELSNAQLFTRGAGNVVDALVPFGDPVKGGLVKDFENNEWLQDTFRPAQDTKQKVLDSVNEIGGSLLPIGVAYKGAEKALDATKGINTLVKGKPKLNYLDEAQKGTATGAAYGIQNEIGKATSGESEGFQKATQNIALETALGAVADPALMGLGQAIKKGAQKVWNSDAIQDPIVKQVFGNKQSKVNMDNLPKDSGGDYNTFNAKVDRSPEKEKGKFGQWYEKARNQFIDDLAPLEGLEKKVRGKIPEAQDSLYKTARLLRGSPEKAHEFVRTRIEPIIKNIENQGYSYEDLGDYALAKHAKDVNKQGMKSGFTNEEITSVLKKLETPAMEEARQQLVKTSTDLLQTLEDADVLEEGTTNFLREKWPNYMPLFRSFDDEKIEFGQGLSNTLANASNPLKKLEGSDRRVIDPIESMVKNTFKAINNADRNRVGQQLARLADDDVESAFIRKVESKEDTKRLNTISVMENGEKIKYEVPPEIYRTITNMDNNASGAVVRMLQKPASMLRAGATLDPVFSLRNPMRDIVQAYVVSNSGFNPIVDFPAGLFNAIFKGKKVKIGGKEYTLGQYYNDFIEANGGFGNIVSMDRELHREALKRGLNDKSNAYVNVVNPKQWLNVLRSIADASETATKVGEFRAAKRKQGVSNEEAAYRARDIMDFSRAGSDIRNWNKVIAFLNANIQGKSKLIRAIKENPTKVSAKAFTSVTLPTVGFYLFADKYSNEKQRQTIEDAPDWLRNTFWLTPIPGTDQVARIPKPFDLVAFSNPVERALDYVKKNDKQAFDGFAREMLSQQSIPVMMTGVAPFVEGMANYSFFRQGPIIPQREKYLEFTDQYDIKTSGTGRYIAEQIDKATQGEGLLKNFGSPRVVDNTIRGLTGGLGSYATNAVDTLFFDDYYERPEAPSKEVITEQTPLRGFLVNEMSTGQSMSELYDLRTKLQKERGSAKQNREPFKNAGKLKAVESATGRIGDVTKRMRVIENDEDMSGDEKREKLEKLNEMRNKIARESWEKIKGR